MKIVQKIFLVASLLISSVGIWAENIQSYDHEALINSLEKGNAITVRGSQYVELPSISAALSRNKSVNHGDNVLDIKGRYVISHKQPSSGIQPLDVATVFPVVLNARTKGLGIVTGDIRVKMYSLLDSTNLAEDYGLQLSNQFDRLELVFYKTEPGGAIAMVERLRADSRVKNADIEVLEHIAVPQ